LSLSSCALPHEKELYNRKTASLDRSSFVARSPLTLATFPVAPTHAAIKDAVEKAKAEIRAQQRGESERDKARIRELTTTIDEMEAQEQEMAV
jgi:hypothetical protein